MSVTENLANFIVETEHDDFPPHIVEHTILCVLDWLGAAFAGCAAPSAILKRLGKQFEIKQNIFKIHASCGHTHGAIDALLEIAQKNRIKPQEVEEIIVGTYPIAVEVVGKNCNPRTASEAKFSLPYCLSIALLNGKVGLTEFSSKMIRNPEVLAVARRIKVRKDPDFVKVRLGGAKVRVRLSHQREYSAQVKVPKGYPENPLTKAELKNKFRNLASLVLPSRQVEEIILTLDNIEELSKVKELTSLLCKPSTTKRHFET